MNAPFWSSEKTQQFLDLTLANKPLTQIAQEMGLTRGMVSGKRRTLAKYGLIPKLPPRGGRKPGATRKLTQTERRRRGRIGPFAPKAPPTIECVGVTLLELERHHCKFIIEDKLYCGLPVEDRSFCSEHLNYCYERGGDETTELAA